MAGVRCVCSAFSKTQEESLVAGGEPGDTGNISLRLENTGETRLEHSSCGH